MNTEIEKTKGTQRLLGEIVSDKMSKTRVLLVRRRVMHPLYRKSLTRTKRFLIHDPRNETQVGDMVEVVSCRPLSKRKHFRLYRVLKKNEGKKG